MPKIGDKAAREEPSEDEETAPRSRRGGGAPARSAQMEQFKKAFLYSTPVLILVLLALGYYVATLPETANAPVHVHVYMDDLAKLNEDYRSIKGDYRAAREQHDSNQKNHLDDTQQYKGILAALRDRCTDVAAKLEAALVEISKDDGPKDPDDLGLAQNLKSLLYEIRHDPG